MDCLNNFTDPFRYQFGNFETDSIIKGCINWCFIYFKIFLVQRLQVTPENCAFQYYVWEFNNFAQYCVFTTGMYWMSEFKLRLVLFTFETGRGVYSLMSMLIIFVACALSSECQADQIFPSFSLQKRSTCCFILFPYFPYPHFNSSCTDPGFFFPRGYSRSQSFLPRLFLIVNLILIVIMRWPQWLTRWMTGNYFSSVNHRSFQKLENIQWAMYKLHASILVKRTLNGHSKYISRVFMVSPLPRSEYIFCYSHN